MSTAQLLLQNDTDPLAARVSARVERILQDILYEFPSLGVYIVRLQRCYNRNIPTACVNGKLLVINPDWLDQHTPAQIRGLLLHEIFHLIARHDLRRGNRDHKIFNIAADYQINLLLVGEKVELPPGGCLDTKYADMTVEQIYNQLYQELQQEAQARQPQRDCAGGQGGNGGKAAAGNGASSDSGSGNGSDGDDDEEDQDVDDDAEDRDDDGGDEDEDRDDDGNDGESQDESGEDEEEDGKDEKEDGKSDQGDQYQDAIDAIADELHNPWGEVIDLTDDEGQPLPPQELEKLLPERDLDNAEAEIMEQMSDAIGTGAGIISRLAQIAHVRPQPPAWDEVLEDILRRNSGANAHDMSRPSKRWVRHGFYIPRLSEGDLGTVVIAIDTSGSVSDALLHAFHDAVDDLLCRYPGTELYVIYCDTVAYPPIYYPPGTTQVQRTHRYGGGGTNFDPPFRKVEEEGIQPDAFIYLTDMYGYVYGAEPSYPTVWVTPLSGKHYYEHITFRGTPTGRPWGEHLIIEPSDKRSF